MKPRVHVVVVAAAFLFVGAAINVAVAWGAARFAAVKGMDTWVSGVKPVGRGREAGAYLGAGLPLPALRWPTSRFQHKHVFGRSSWSAGVRLDQYASWKALPVDPIWHGFVINTGFYSALLAGGWYGSVWLLRERRRVRRRRAGACLLCGYARAGLAVDAACPECGGLSKR